MSVQIAWSNSKRKRQSKLSLPNCINAVGVDLYCNKLFIGDFYIAHSSKKGERVKFNLKKRAENIY